MVGSLVRFRRLAGRCVLEITLGLHEVVFETPEIRDVWLSCVLQYVQMSALLWSGIWSVSPAFSITSRGAGASGGGAAEETPYRSPPSPGVQAPFFVCVRSNGVSGSVWQQCCSSRSDSRRHPANTPSLRWQRFGLIHRILRTAAAPGESTCA